MKKHTKTCIKPYKKINLKEEFGNGKTVYLDFGIFKMRVMDYGGHKNIHINLNRAKKPYRNIDTYTNYCSIVEGDKVYTEVWLDRQKKQVVGVELFWE